MNTSVTISDHPFYETKEGKEAKEILVKLTEICGFDTTIGVQYFEADSPMINLGIIDPNSKSKIPSFKMGKQIDLYLRNKRKPIQFHRPTNRDYETRKKIFLPLKKHWKEINSLLEKYYYPRGHDYYLSKGVVIN
ncbi:MAG: hypothetical protein WCO35_01610 [Candidatus Nomurabacteria bacterium]